MSLLQVEGVNVHFGGLHALRDVDLDVAAGSVTGLIGPNGAGKTTLFNVICGLQPTTKGKVLFDDEDVTEERSHERARLGIGRTFQRLEVFGSLSAEQNVLVAAEIRKRWSGDKTNPHEVTREVLDLVGISHIAEHRVDAMPTGLARLVELARALAVKPRLLLLDEPSSGLNERESDAFADLLGHLVGTGLGILLVEHDVELVMRVCARIHVLDFGKIIAAGTPPEIQANVAVQAAYLGAVEPAGAVS